MDFPRMCQSSRQAAGDSFLGMAPCGPLYSRVKSLRRPASNGGVAKSVYRLFGQVRLDEIRVFTPELGQLIDFLVHLRRQ
jgi:hypothetical protein